MPVARRSTKTCAGCAAGRCNCLVHRRLFTARAMKQRGRGPRPPAIIAISHAPMYASSLKSTHHRFFAFAAASFFRALASCFRFIFSARAFSQYWLGGRVGCSIRPRSRRMKSSSSATSSSCMSSTGRFIPWATQLLIDSMGFMESAVLSASRALRTVITYTSTRPSVIDGSETARQRDSEAVKQ